MKRFTLSLLTACLTLLIAGCGGGGGDSFLGSGTIDGEISPREVDPGDRVEIRAFIDSVNSDGVLIKVRYPQEFTYVEATSFLLINGIEFDIDPASLVNLESGTNTLLTYILPPEFFEDTDNAVVVAQFRLNEEIEDEMFEFDIDTLDTGLTAASLNAETLADEFDAEDGASVDSPQN